MRKIMADALAQALGGKVELDPETRRWGIEWTRPDGKFLTLEAGGAYLFASRESFDAFHRGDDYEVSPVIDGAEWDSPLNDTQDDEHDCGWGNRDWATLLAPLMLGRWYDTGGGLYVVMVERPDGTVAELSETGVCIYASDRDAFENPEDSLDAFFWD